MQDSKLLNYFGFLALIVVSVSSVPHLHQVNDEHSSSQILKALNSPLPNERISHQEPPQYMLDLYNEVADSKGMSKSPLPFGASIVRAVPVQVDNKGCITFSLERIPDEEVILEAEVHIHHRKLSDQQRRILGHRNLFKFNLIVIGDDEPYLADSQTVGGHFSGWRKFSVGEVIAKERKFERITFKVEAHTLEGLPLNIKLHHVHQVTNNPILVLFNRIVNGSRVSEELPLIKDHENFHGPKRVVRSVGEDSSPADSLLATPPLGCELRSLYIDFDDIGWSSWVVYPRGYDAFHCSGQCAFPLGQDLQPTNHATVVSIVHHSSNGLDGVNQPFCVPTSYKSLALLYYDEEDTVILKQFEDMIATQCGCR